MKAPHSRWLAASRRSLLTVGLVLLHPALGQAKDKAETTDAAESLVLIRPLQGPDAAEIQISVEAAVAENFGAVSASADEEAELAKGAAVMVRMSREKKYRAYVAGVVEKTQKGRNLVLTVYSGKDGEPVGETKLFAPNMQQLSTKIDAQAAKPLAALLRKTEAAAGPGSGEAAAQEGKEVVTLEPEVEEPQQAPEPEEAAGGGPSPLDVNAGVGFMNLDLTYNQPVSDSFGFQLMPRPTTPLTVRVGAHVYPGAFFTTNALADVGLDVSYYHALGGSLGINAGATQASYDVEFTELNIGLRGRIRMGEAELGLIGGWGQMGAIVAGDNEPFANNPVETDPGLFPDIRYTYLRLGVDGRTPVFEPLSVAAGVHLRLPSIGKEPGELREPRWFPRASASGIDLQLTILYALTENFTVLLGGDARAYGLTMHSNPGDVRQSAIAGGASDLYLGGFGGVEARF